MTGLGGDLIVALEAARNVNLDDIVVSTQDMDLLNIEEMIIKLGAGVKRDLPVILELEGSPGFLKLSDDLPEVLRDHGEEIMVITEEVMAGNMKSTKILSWTMIPCLMKEVKNMIPLPIKKTTEPLWNRGMKRLLTRYLVKHMSPLMRNGVPLLPKSFPCLNKSF